MLGDHTLDFADGDLLTTLVDQLLLDAARNRELTQLIHGTEVTGAKPSIHKCAGVSIGVVQVAIEYTGTARYDLALRVGRDKVAALIHDAHFVEKRHTDRSRFANARRRRHAGKRPGFRHRVTVEDRGAERRLEPAHDHRTGGARSSYYETQLCIARDLAMIVDAIEDGLMHRVAR